VLVGGVTKKWGCTLPVGGGAKNSLEEGRGGGGGLSINSKTGRDRAKSFRRKRCTKDLGVQWNWNEVNQIINKKVIDRRKMRGSRATCVRDINCL